MPTRSSYSNEQTTLGAYLNNYDDYSYNSNRSSFSQPSRNSTFYSPSSYDRKSDCTSNYQRRYSTNFTNSRTKNLDSSHCKNFFLKKIIIMQMMMKFFF